MKIFLQLFCIVLLTVHVSAQDLNGSEEDRNSLEKATLAIREAFAKGDTTLIAKLHHPDVVKYFGGNNVMTGNAAVEKGQPIGFVTRRLSLLKTQWKVLFLMVKRQYKQSSFQLKLPRKPGAVL